MKSKDVPATRKPQKDYVSRSITIPKQLLGIVDAIAVSEHRNRSQQITVFLEQAVSRRDTVSA